MAKSLFSDLLYVETIYRESRTENQILDALEKLSKEYYATTPLFEVEFNKPLTAIRKLYYHLITNETTVLFNNLINDFERTSVPEENHFLFQKHQKNFSYTIKNIADYLSERELTSELFAKPNKNEKADEAYIIYFLKANSIMLLMELQERFENHNTSETYTQEEIHEIYFKEEPPENLLVTSYSGVQINIKKPITVNENFKAIKGDLNNRTENAKIIEYNKIIAKPDTLARLEETLFNEKIIDHNYDFIPTKGNKQLLAAFIHQLINKEIISPRIFPGIKLIKDRDISKFFAQRYGNNSDTNKEFRNFKNNEKHKLKSTIESNRWLDAIR